MINSWIAKSGIVIAVAGVLASGSPAQTNSIENATTLPAYDSGPTTLPANDQAPEVISDIQMEKVELEVEAVNENIDKIILKREEKPHAGYDIVIAGIDFSSDKEAFVRYYLIEPAEGEFYAQVITQPEAYVYIPSEYTATAVNGADLIQLPAPGEPVPLPTPIEEDGEEVVQGVDFSGAIHEVTAEAEEGKLGVIKIGEAEAPATIHILDSTTLVKLENGEEVPATWEDLAVGAEVDVTFDGPIPMIYPPMGNAGKVVIK